MKPFLLYCLLFATAQFALGQVFLTQDWQRFYYGQNEDCRGREVKVDSLGFVYNLGHVGDQAVSLNGTSIMPSKGHFVTKTDSNGVFVSTHPLLLDKAFASRPTMTVDAAGNTFISGTFSDSTDIDPGPGTQWIYAQGGGDALTYKLDPAGNIDWVLHQGGPYQARGAAVRTDEQGNVWVLGIFGDSLDIDPGPGTHWLTTPGNNSGVFLEKLDSAGNVLWAKAFSATTGIVSTKSLAFGPNQEIYLAGMFRHKVDFDPSPGMYVLDAGSTTDAFQMKLSPDGDLIWVQAIGGDGSLSVEDIVSNESGDLYTIGNMNIDSVDFDSGPDTSLLAWPVSWYGANRSVYLQKVNTHGDFQWVRQFMGGNEDEGWINASGLVIDACGFVYGTGSALWGATFVSGAGENGGGDSPENHNSQQFLFKVAPDGTVLWTEELGYWGEAAEDYSYDVALDQFGHLFLTGIGDTYGSDFNWSIARYSQPQDTFNTVDTLIYVSTCQSYTSPSGNYAWTSSGVYYDTLFACRNTAIEIHLSTGVGTDTTLKLGECAPFNLNGYTYDSPGSYTQVINNAEGCDSVITLDLAILSSSDSSFSTTTCAYYQLNAENYTSSGTYVQTIPNSIGCDSVITLDLTIIPASQASLTDTACGSYVLNGETFTIGGTFSQLLLNESGCDSILTLNLTLLDSLNLGLSQSGTILSALATGVSYQWLDCEQGFAPIPGETSQQLQTSGLGSYAVILSNGLCSDTSACASFSVGLDGSFPTAWQLFPNPSQGLLHLKLDQVYEQVSVRVFTVLGQEISQQQLPSGSQEAVIVLPPQPGLYLIEVSADGQRSVAKVLRE